MSMNHVFNFFNRNNEKIKVARALKWRAPLQ